MLPPLPVMSAEDAMLPVSKSITAELREQWAVLNEVWGTPMAQWKGVAVAAWMEAAIGECVLCVLHICICIVCYRNEPICTGLQGEHQIRSYATGV